MTRNTWKTRALTLIRTTLPNPCIVTIPIVVVGWLFSILTQRMKATPLYLNLDAMQKMNIDQFLVIDWSKVTVFSFSLFIAFQILLVILNFGYTRYTLSVSRRIKTGFSELLSGFDFPVKACLLSLMEWLIESLLLCLLIVPGIIAIYSFSMAKRLLCDHPDWSPLQCMQESRLMMRGHKWELFEVHISFLFLFLLTIIPVVSIFFQPYFNLTVNEFYLFRLGEDRNVSPEEENEDVSNL